VPKKQSTQNQEIDLILSPERSILIPYQYTNWRILWYDSRTYLSTTQYKTGGQRLLSASWLSALCQP